VKLTAGVRRRDHALVVVVDSARRRDRVGVQDAAVAIGVRLSTHDRGLEVQVAHEDRDRLSVQALERE
jgi:hypothetical protein